MNAMEERLQDIRKNPDKHRHIDLNDLTRCCITDGAINTLLMEAHEGLTGTNGGRGCDVLSGPCACGAWHR